MKQFQAGPLLSGSVRSRLEQGWSKISICIDVDIEGGGGGGTD